YRRAIELVPERLSVRSALAELLSHRAGDSAEALAHLRPLLEANPADAGCLRVALRIARTRGADARPGIAILHALGQASAYEVDEAGHAADWRPNAEPTLADAHHETLRALAVECAEALASAIAQSAPETRARSAPSDVFRAALARAEGELAAPVLVGLS